MLKRFVLTLVSLLLLLIAVLISLLPLLLVRVKLEDATFVWAFCLWAALAILSLIPLSGRIVRNIWFFSGIGDPVTLESLRERLLAINAMDCPVAVINQRKKLILTWRYQEAQWCELFSRLGISRLYELHCRFDTATRTVFLVDRVRNADFLICPDGIKIGWSRIPLPLLRANLRRLSTIEQYATVPADDYTFHPREIKSPVLGTVVACGWNVRFSLW